MPLELVFEIGTEEIPAGFLARAITDLTALAEERLRAARLPAASLRVIGTPRRLALLASGLPERQPDVSERVAGPPVAAAFDKAGKPTPAAVGFAKKNGVEVTALERGEVEGKKGEYVLCTRSEPGRAAREVLAQLLEDLCKGIPWAKSMRWGNGEDAFARPVHWIVALLGGELLPLRFAGIAAAGQTRGHRFLAPGAIKLDGTADQYLTALRKAFVIASPDERRNMIRAELARIEESAGVKVRSDERLVDEVSNLVEYPVAVCGEFDRQYLEVPQEVVVSAMRAHQRYFATEDGGGALANKFVTIAGTVTRDVAVVRGGNERVLAARLSDASFFFREDQKVPLAERAARLEHVVFQAKLGTVAAKVARIGKNGAAIARAVGADAAQVARVAALCKADLVTLMVGEFPDLQGVMGRYYARAAGESEAVALAIEEHYLPRGAADRLPGSPLGAVVGLADCIDTLVGCFSVGLVPSGSADPYGLRRAALAILQVLIDRKWSALPLGELIATAQSSLAGTAPVGAEQVAAVREFLRVRLRGLLEGRDLPADCVDAALAAGFDDVPDALARAEAVARLRTRADFEPLASAFKRVANILKGDTPAAAGKAPVDPAVFTEEDERALWTSFSRIEAAVQGHLSRSDYHAALGVLVELKGPVDRFFDKVLVMDKDERVKANRLAMLGRINATFTRIADFRQLAV